MAKDAATLSYTIELDQELIAEYQQILEEFHEKNKRFKIEDLEIVFKNWIEQAMKTHLLNYHIIKAQEKYGV
jgi:hypothetical protein